MTTLSPLQYIDLTDFTPGIWSGFLTGVNSIPAPLGSAQETDTYGCIASPQGGLIPLPAAQVSSVPVPEASPASTNFYVNGIRALPTGLHYGLTWLEQTTNNEKFRWYRDGSAAVEVITHTGGAIVPAAWVPQAFTTAITRLTSAGAVANISIVGSWSDRTGGGGRTWFFPDPATPSNNAPAVDTDSSGQLFAHQARILCFTPYTVAHGTAGVNTTTTNELINYTDPPQGIVIGAQQTLLSPESPFGYGAWGSVSAGELILIKFFGGGVMMYDDIVYPRVVRLPAVMGTNGYMQEGSFCSIGMVYVSRLNGVYAWNGNNVSEKISHQIDVSRLAPNAAKIVMGFGSNPYISHTKWLDRVVFPHNWVFDPAINSWWKLQSPSNDIVWWSAYGPNLYGLPASYSPTPGSQLFTFDPILLTGIYSWKSQPISAATPGKTFSIREVEVIAQTGALGTAGSIIQMTLSAPEGTATVLNFTLTAAALTTPEKIIVRLDTPLTCSNVTVKVLVTSADSFFAPTIHSIRIGYGEDRLSGSYYQ